MDTSPEVRSSHLFSLALSSLGWIVAAGAAIWFIVFGKSAFTEAGYQQGRTDQTAEDIRMYESAFGGGVESQPLNNLVNVRVLRTQPGSLTAEELPLGPATPFDGSAKQFTIVYDANTPVVRRVIIAPEEYQRRMNAAIEASQNPMLIPPYDDIPVTTSEIAAGMRLEVVAQDARALSGNSFAAQSIAIVIEPVASQP